MAISGIYFITLFIIYILHVAGGFQVTTSNEYRIHHLLFQTRSYNKLVRPEGDTAKGSLTVKLNIILESIMDVSEKNQILTTSLWLRHEWTDSRLSWDPRDTGGMNYTVIPSELLWIPDIILYNNADGDFVISLMTKATVYHTGRIVWNPPAIYKSYCPIDVEFFPFDQQECFMKFGSWTNDIHMIDLRHNWEKDRGVSLGQTTFIPYGIDICGYQKSGEWDLINVTATRANKVYPCCQDDPYPYLMFNITIRRKTLFYTINLIVPIVTLSSLSVLVFYLPSHSGEKITLVISILLALTVFLLILSDINPPTSLVIPLIVKFLMFTLIMVTLATFLTVYILKVHCCGPATHSMKPWVRRVFLNQVPKYILLERPPSEQHTGDSFIRVDDEVDEESEINGLLTRRSDSESKSEERSEEGSEERSEEGSHEGSKEESVEGLKEESEEGSEKKLQVLDKGAEKVRFSDETSGGLRRRSAASHVSDPGRAGRKILVKTSVEGIRYIADHMRSEDEDDDAEQDWTFLAMVVDRLFLFVMTTAVILGTGGIFLNAPTLYDPVVPLTGELLGGC